MALIFTDTLRYLTSRNSSDSVEHSNHDGEGAVPILASPVDPKAYAWLRRKRLGNKAEPGKLKRSLTVAQFESEHTENKLAGRIFRKQHEASSLELFFDLFFVANLAVFTNNHAHVDASSVANYIGFFSIIWSLWFNVSIHDVRFHTDCAVSRLFNVIDFGVMTAFVGLGPTYDTIDNGGESRAFQGLALVLMGIRFAFCIRYGLVLYFVQGFQKTLAPLLLMIFLYSISGLAFLATYLADNSASLTGLEGSHHAGYWYIIIGLEALAVITVSSIWRVLSFKHTHLVERVGLLTLIVMGEGIIGLLKSVAYVLAGSNVSVWAETGLVAAAVLLIYFVYLLYFTNIDHDRFGSIRQQLWALLHYLLHVAILLTVEGQTALTIWDATRNAITWFEIRFPDPTNPAAGFDSMDDLMISVNRTISETTARYHYGSLSSIYDVNPDIEALQNNTEPFASAGWNASTSELLSNIKYNIEYFIFYNFQAESPEMELEETKDPAEKVRILNDSFKFVFEYFYIAAGGLLIMLAVLYWFGKTHKKADEWCSIVLRIVVGLAIPCVSATAFLEEEGGTSSFRFKGHGLIIAVVTFSYVAVLIGDNIIKIVFSVGRRRRDSRASSLADVETAYGTELQQQRSGGSAAKQGRAAEGVQSRRESHASDSELIQAVEAERNGRGYSSVGQHDEHEHDEARERSYV